MERRDIDAVIAIQSASPEVAQWANADYDFTDRGTCGCSGGCGDLLRLFQVRADAFHKIGRGLTLLGTTARTSKDMIPDVTLDDLCHQTVHRSSG